MTENSEVSIVDIVSSGRRQAVEALQELFRTKHVTDLLGYESVLNSMQSLPEQLMTEVGAEIVSRFFSDARVDVTDSSARAVMAPFAPVMAQGITSAAQAIYSQMQQQHQKTQNTHRSLLV